MRDPQASGSLIMRRREIARSFVDWSLGAQEPLWERLHEITIPVLWVVGENDAKFIALAERAVSLMPLATLIIAPQSCHRVPWDAEEWLAEKVSHFLKTGI
jgi:2-succinyl-6-hydroxy-2,4-cyclohexadiene-1-carboxylate synthase